MSKLPVKKPRQARATTTAAAFKTTLTPKATASSSSYSFTSFVRFLNENFSLILLIGIFFVLGFIVGSLWTENQLNKGQTTKTGTQAEVQPTAPEGPTEADFKKVPPVTKDDHIRGNLNTAKLVLVEYSDYECPFCNRFHPTMQQVIKEYGDKVAWVYRNYPLPFHAQAQRSAETAECVAELGGNEAFWKFTDAVYTDVSARGAELALAETNFKLLANQAGVNGDKVLECAKSGKMTEKVKKDMAGGSAAGVSGTPGTIIIAGDKYDLIPGALPFEQVKIQLDGLLK